MIHRSTRLRRGAALHTLLPIPPLAPEGTSGGFAIANPPIFVPVELPGSMTKQRSVVPSAVVREVARPDLPVAPSDAEKYAYLQPQHRSLIGVQTLVSLAVSGWLTLFFLQHAVLMPFVVVTAINIIYAIVSAWTGLRARRVHLGDHIATTSTWTPEAYPSADIFLPSAGEPLDVLDNTFRHVSALKWEGQVTVLVLDDSARSDVERLALQYDFEYHSRPDRGRMKKAGNLLYGYNHSCGDIIAVFDADFCPRPDFLLELVPYFDDPDVGIVQSPQYFRTQSTMNWLQSAAGSVQEIFYRWVQPSRDAASGAICVGTCALYRRAGLVRSGGFAQIGHSEDVHTGVNLMKVGFATRYVPVVLAAGLCPDNYAGFLSQQYRWCAGSMSLLSDRSFHTAPLTINQRLCFFTGFLYYLSTAATFFGGPLSAAVLVWMLPQEVWPWSYLPLVVASWCVFIAWKSMLTTRWTLSVMRVQMLYSAAHAVAIWHSLRGRTAAWVPTGAAPGSGIPLSTKISRLAFGWLVTIEIILVTGVTRGVLQYGLERFWLSIVLIAFSLAIVVPMLRPLCVVVRDAKDIANGSARMTLTWLCGAIACLGTLPTVLAIV